RHGSVCSCFWPTGARRTRRTLTPRSSVSRMPSEPDALPLAGSEARRPTSFAARWPWQLLQLLATILTGVWPRRGAWWSVAVASLVCVAATPLLASLHARDAGFDDEALFTHAAQAPCDHDHRLVDPLELFAECEQQAVTDA